MYSSSLSQAQEVYSRPVSATRKHQYVSKFGRTKAPSREERKERDLHNKSTPSARSNSVAAVLNREKSAYTSSSYSARGNGSSHGHGELEQEYLGMRINSLSARKSAGNGDRNDHSSARTKNGKMAGTSSASRRNGGQHNGDAANDNTSEWRRYSIDNQLESLEELLRLERQRLIRSKSGSVLSNTTDAYYHETTSDSPARGSNGHPRPPSQRTSSRGERVGASASSPNRRRGVRQQNSGGSRGGELPSMRGGSARRLGSHPASKLAGDLSSESYDASDSLGGGSRVAAGHLAGVVPRPSRSEQRSANGRAHVVPRARKGTPADWEVGETSDDYDDNLPEDDGIYVDEDDDGEEGRGSFESSDTGPLAPVRQRPPSTFSTSSRRATSGKKDRVLTAKSTPASTSRSSAQRANRHGRTKLSPMRTGTAASSGYGRPSSGSNNARPLSSSVTKVPPLSKRASTRSAGPRVINFQNINDVDSSTHDDDSPTKKKKMPVMYARLSLNVNIIKNMFKAAGYRITKVRDDWHCWWGKHWKMEQFRELEAYQKVNHFPGTFALGRKDRLHKNLSRMQRHYGNAYDFFPQSWIVPAESEDLRREFRLHGGMFIAKPCASARGIGIKVITDISQVPRKKSYLIQRYLADPYLIDGFKFDLRLYVLVTSFDPLRIYLYDDGLVRFCTERYKKNPKNSSNKFMHLTNYSLQKNREGFVENQDAEADDIGNKWSIKALKRYFKENDIDDSGLWRRIDDLIVKTIISVEDAINTACGMYVKHKNTCYELFGFDVLIDKNLKPWIVEVNVSPSLHSASPLDKKIKTAMVTDMFNLLRFQAMDKDQYERKKRQERQDRLVGRGIDRATSASAGHRTQRRRPLSQIDWSTFRNLSDQDFEVLVGSQEEFDRKGDFHRIFPTADTSPKYDKFFPYQRYNNTLLHQFIARGGTAETLAARQEAQAGSSRPPTAGRPKTRQSTSRGAFY